MNKIFSLVWNRAKKQVEVASELATHHSGATCSAGIGSMRRALLASCVVFALGAVPLAALAGQVDCTGATATGANALACGDGASAAGVSATALGSDANAAGQSAVAVGDNANATNNDSDYSTLVGSGNVNYTYVDPVTGIAYNAASIAGEYSTAFGWGSQAYNRGDTAFGTYSHAGIQGGPANFETYDTALGYQTFASGGVSLAIGSFNHATGQASVAVGYASDAAGQGAVAVGPVAVAEGNLSVALGAGSVALVDNNVSLGHAATDIDPTTGVAYGSELDRTISHVAAGTANTDAVNVGQLDTAVAGATAHYVSVNDGGTQGGNYDNDGATGLNAMAAGVAASASGNGSIAAGYGASATGENSQALGSGSHSYAAGDTALGQNAVAHGGGYATTNLVAAATAVGSGASATGSGSAAFGMNATAAGSESVAIGFQANMASSFILTPVGDTTNSVSIGGGEPSDVFKDSLTGINYTGAQIAGMYSTSIGWATEALNRGDTAVGSHAHAGDLTQDGTVETYDTALGYKSTATGGSSIAIGTFNHALGIASVAVGASATAAGDYSMALGAGANDGGFANAVALGTGSVVDRDNSVSVGAAGSERQITNVAAGSADTDAVNVGQLDSAVADATTHYYSVNDGGTQGGNYDNDGASGTNALAAGVGASATTTGALALGNGASVVALAYTPLGGTPTTSGANNALALGTGSVANGNQSVAIGDLAKTGVDTYTLTHFGGTGLTSANAVAIGWKALTLGDRSVGIGSNVVAGGNGSVALGNLASVTADNSIAIGNQTRASTDAINIGYTSHHSSAYGGAQAHHGSVVIGINTVSTGAYTSVQGSGNTVWDDHAVAIGTGNTIGKPMLAPHTGSNSHGYYVNGGYGASSIALGNGNTITSAHALALGNNINIGDGNDYAVALGDGATVAPPDTSYYNPGTGVLAGTATSVLSIGSAGNERQIQNVAPGSNATDAVNVSQLQSLANAMTASETHYYSVNTSITPDSGIPVTGAGSNYNNDGASGAGALAAGLGATATGQQSVSIGFQSNIQAAMGGPYSYVPIGNTDFSVAIGGGEVSDVFTDSLTGITYSGAQIAGMYSTSVGWGTEALNRGDTAVGSHAHAGDATRDGTVETYDTALGYKSTASGGVSVAVGTFNHALGAASVAIGFSTLAQGAGSSAIGSGAQATGAGSIASGGWVDTNGNGQAEPGEVTVASGAYSSAFGSKAVASGDNSLASGYAANAAGYSATALGNAAGATGDSSVAVGNSSFANNDYATAVGPFAAASGYAAVAMGDSANASGDYSVALGNYATADAKNGVALGSNASTAGFANSVALGAGSTVDRANSVSVGSPGAERQITNVADGTAPTDAATVAQLDTAVAGATTHYFSVNDNGTQGGNYDNSGATGLDTAAIGVGANAAGDFSVALGNNAYAASRRAIAIGQNATSSGAQAFALGSYAAASGNNSVALGGAVDLNGNGTIDPGEFTTATGGLSLALGVDSQATDTNASAIGAQAVASGLGSTAVGSSALTSGTGSAALGFGAQATADGAVAIGWNSVADAVNTVSVGSAGNYRRIVNVADPTGAHDAVTLGYLQSNYTSTDALASLSQQMDALNKQMANLGRASVSSAAQAGSPVVAQASGDSPVPEAGNAAVGSQTQQAVATANAYTDQQTQEALQSANTYAQSQGSQALSSAKAYTDAALANYVTTDTFDQYQQQVNARFSQQDQRIDRTSAMSTAMVQMAASAAGIDTPNRVGVGVGATHGESALAIGYQRAIGKHATFTIGGSASSGESTVGAGVGFGW